MSQYANMMSLFLSLTSELFADDITSSLAGALDSYYIAFSAGSIWQWNEKGRPPPCDCIWSGFIIVSSLVCCYVYLPHQFFIFRFFSFCCYSIQLRTTTAILAAKNTSCSVQLAADWPSFWAASSPSSTSFCAPTRRRCTTLRRCPPTSPPSR